MAHDAWLPGYELVAVGRKVQGTMVFRLIAGLDLLLRESGPFWKALQEAAGDMRALALGAHW